MPNRSNDEEATLSLPSLAIVAILGFVIYRYILSSRSASAGSRPNGLRFTAAQVEQISQMFPQLNRRDIMWDLHRNRGSVQATTERILAGRDLESAPPSFQPPITISTSSSAPMAPKPQKAETDLITRYNLQSKISTKGKERADAPVPSGWASSRDQRQAMLQQRRDEMILAARRRMQDRDEDLASQTSGGPA